MVATASDTRAGAESLLSQAADVIAAGMDVACIRIWVLSPDRKTLELCAANGPNVPFDGLGERVPIEGSELGEVVRSGLPHVVSCVDETVPADVRSWAESVRVISFAAVPMAAGRETIGVAAVFSRVSLGEESVNMLRQLAGLVARSVKGTTERDSKTASEELLQSLIRCLPSAVITLDREGLVTRWSATAESLFGWTAAEVFGKPLPFVLDERRHEFPDNLTETLIPGRGLRSRTVCRRADDTLCHVHRSTSPICDANGEIGGRVEVFVDESHRVQTTRCLQVQAQVTRIVTGCRTLNEAAPLLLAAVGEWLGCEASEFWTLDEKQDALSRVAVWASTPANRERLSASAIRVHATSSEWPAEAFQEGRTLFREDIDSPSAKALSPVRGVLRVPVSGVAIPIRTDQLQLGVMTCLGGSRQQPDDLTQHTLSSIADAVAQFLTRLRTEAALTQSESNLRQSQKMDAIGLLAGGVAHDFNNLLTIILAYSEMGLSEVDESHELHELFAEVHGAGERAAAMTRQLLAVSRQQPTRVTNVNLNRLVADMERMLQRLVGTNITLTCECEESLSPVHADANQWEQVLLNLVVNARDAMPDGGTVTVRTSNVTLRAAEVSRDDVRPGEYVRIAVSDTGCGMDAATQTRIFEPFFTTKEVGRGTGMGLSTVFGIIKQSGGLIRVDSELKVGTTFSIFLPQSDDVLAVRSFNEEPDVSPVGTERILVVENDASVRQLIRRLLEVRGYTVQEAIHGGEALEILKKRRPAVDLVLTDIQMPVVNGIALARKIEELPHPPKLLMMSGDTEPPADLKLDRSYQFLAKPFTSDLLAQRVRMVLDAEAVTRS